MRVLCITVCVICLLFISCKDDGASVIGLRGEVQKTAEVIFSGEYDSLNNLPYDTLSVKETFYQDSNQVIRYTERTLYDGERMEIEYLYENNKLLAEVVKLSDDTSRILYKYNGDLMQRATCSYESTEFSYDINNEYTYNNENELIKITCNQLFINQENGDTINNVEDVDYLYKQVCTSRYATDKLYPVKSKRFDYSYKEGELSRMRVFNYKNDLVSTFHYKYKYDNAGNWIEKIRLEDGKIVDLAMRHIDYR